MDQSLSGGFDPSRITLVVIFSFRESSNMRAQILASLSTVSG